MLPLRKAGRSHPGTSLGCREQNTQMGKGKKRPSQVGHPEKRPWEHKNPSSSGWLEGSFETIPKQMLERVKQRNKEETVPGQWSSHQRTQHLFIWGLGQGEGLTNGSLDGRRRGVGGEWRNGILNFILGSIANKKSSSVRPISNQVLLVPNRKRIFLLNNGPDASLCDLSQVSSPFSVLAPPLPERKCH